MKKSRIELFKRADKMGQLRNSDIQSHKFKPVNYEDPTAQLGYADTVHIGKFPKPSEINTDQR